jgi:hypothetical protein
MAGLTNNTIASSYDQLVISNNASGGDTSNLITLQDGDGGTTYCVSMNDASTGKSILSIDGSHANGTALQIDNSAGDGDVSVEWQLSGTTTWLMGIEDGDSDSLKICNDSTMGADERLSFLSGATVFNDDSGDVDFRVEGNGNANLLFCDAGDDRVGIGTNAPASALDVRGTVTLGVDDTGVDLRVYSATTNEGLHYDASEDELGLLLTTKLKFHDIGGDEEIFASANGHLEINAGTTLDITAPTVDLNSATEFNIDTVLYDLNASGATTLNGVPVTITSTGDITLDSSTDIILDADGDNITMKAGSTGSGLDFIQSGNGDYTIKNLTSDKDIIFNVNDGGSDTEVMRIDGSVSRVGIGTTIPDTNLHVWDGDAGSISLTTNAVAVLESAAHTRLQFNAPDTNTPGIIFSSPTYQDHNAIHSHLAAAGTGNIQFEVSNNVVMTLKDDGNVRRVGIGYEYPQGELHVRRYANSVDGSDAGEGQIYISGKEVAEGSGSRIAALYFGCAEGGGWEGAAIRACASDDYDTNDWPTRLGFWTQTDGAAALTEHFRIDEDGTLTGTDTDIGSISDVRIKRDIEDYSGGLAFLKQLQPRTFRFKNQSRHGIKDENFISKGFIADEVEVVDSSWVKLHHVNVDDQDREYAEDTDGLLKQIPFGAKDAVYVSAIQEMQKVIEELSAKVTALENA